MTSVGFGVITAFVSLFFAERGWDGAAWMFSAFGVGFILARVFFAGLPDKLGGARVALVCVVVEAVGQWLIWSGATPLWAYGGALLTGAGYSLAFPSFGVEAVRRVPAASRGAAMGRMWRSWTWRWASAARRRVGWRARRGMARCI